jgi:hypothetical protein
MISFQVFLPKSSCATTPRDAERGGDASQAMGGGGAGAGPVCESGGGGMAPDSPPAKSTMCFGGLGFKVKFGFGGGKRQPRMK